MPTRGNLSWAITSRFPLPTPSRWNCWNENSVSQNDKFCYLCLHKNNIPLRIWKFAYAIFTRVHGSVKNWQLSFRWNCRNSTVWYRYRSKFFAIILNPYNGVSVCNNFPNFHGDGGFIFILGVSPEWQCDQPLENHAHEKWKPSRAFCRNISITIAMSFV